jgi:hypothetical protein
LPCSENDADRHFGIDVVAIQNHGADLQPIGAEAPQPCAQDQVLSGAEPVPTSR